MSFNSNNFKKFAGYLSKGDISKTESDFNAAAENAFRQDRVNDAAYYKELAKQIRENANKPNFNMRSLMANVQDKMSQMAFNRQKALAQSPQIQQYLQWQGLQRYNQAYKDLGLWDKVRLLFGSIMHKMGINMPNSYFNKFNEKVKGSIQSGIMDDLDKKVTEEIHNRYAKSLGFVDEKGNPLQYTQMTPEQQKVYQKGYYNFAEQNQKQIYNEITTPEMRRPSGWHFFDQGIWDETGNQVRSYFAPFKDSEWKSSLNPDEKYDFTSQPVQSSVAKGLPSTIATPTQIGSKYIAKGSSAPTRMQSNINNANPRRRPQDSRKPSVVQTPSTIVSAQEAEDEFQV